MGVRSTVVGYAFDGIYEPVDGTDGADGAASERLVGLELGATLKL